MAAAVVAAARVLKRKAPRGFLRNLIKRRKPQLHLKSGIDLWVSAFPARTEAEARGTLELFTISSSISRRNQDAGFSEQE
ncbi:centromere protein W isoform X2 [Phascolarctos cinereus]|uniref:Centromere protein W isoform X2 n=1 Tax=Phascolarctos cinereus TaxID=38626 RepID=A0A6P5KE58_PHACI|nr:centromere protein W isoform X2 [Phascolarctos cinereus]